MGSFALNAAEAVGVKTTPNLLMSTKTDHLGQRDKPFGLPVQSATAI
jgi:hypothetical protein